MRKLVHTLLLVMAMLMPLTTNAQTDSMLVNVAVNDPTMGTTNPAPGAHYFYLGDTCHVIAIANDGYVLSGWNIQWSFMNNILTDTTINLPLEDVFDLVAMLNSGTGWVVEMGHHWYSFSVTANFVAASEYIPDSMIVNVAVNDPAMGTTLPAPGAYHFGVGDTVSVVAMANEGYHLTGWNVQVTLAEQDLLDTTINVPVADIFPVIATVLTGGSAWVVTPLYVNATISVTANFVDAGQYVPDSMIVNVAVNNPAMGTTIPGTGTHYFAEGDTCHVVAVANDGYHLTGWTIQIEVEDAVLVDTTIDIAIRDVFDMVILIEEIRSRGEMSAYELLQLLASPIGDWVVDPLYAQAAFNLTANFAAGDPASTHITYAVEDVTSNSDTPGVTDPAPGTYSINAGDPVIVSATPNEGFELSAWIMEYTYSVWGIDLPVVSDTIYSDNPAFSNPIRFLGVMQQMVDTLPEIGMYVTALFTPHQHTVTLGTADTTMGTVNPTGDSIVSFGQTFTATAMPKTGYLFEKWVDGSNHVVSVENPYTFTVSGDVSLVAHFISSGSEGIDDIETDNFHVYTIDNNIIVKGAENKTVIIFDALGRNITEFRIQSSESRIEVPGSGIYMVKVGDSAAKRVVVVR